MKDFSRLVQIMADLRDPERGCPWDLKQTEETLREYILEETYELIEAIEEKSPRRQQEELGDLLLQIVFLSRLHEEKGDFGITEVVASISEKLIRRHPHIFADANVSSAAEVKSNWEKIKKAEKSRASALSDYPDRMPSLLVARRIAEQAASVGFDWQDRPPQHAAINEVIKKVEEEISELKQELTRQTDSVENSAEIDDERKLRLEEEVGDLLFAVSNVARHLDINPEFALKKANDKFKKRFRFIESQLNERGKNIEETGLEEMEKLWRRAKTSHDPDHE